jgi:hypothetical protein
MNPQAFLVKEAILQSMLWSAKILDFSILNLDVISSDQLTHPRKLQALRNNVPGFYHDFDWFRREIQKDTYSRVGKRY